MRARGRALRARRRRRLRALHARERGDLPGRLRAARPRRRSTRGPTWLRVAARPACASRATARVYGLVAKHVRDARLRVVLSFHPLLVGGNPFATTSDLHADRVPRAPLGRALRDGRHRHAGAAAWSGLIEGQGGAVRCNAEVAEITVARRRGDRRAARVAARRSPPTSSSPTPTRPGPTGTCCPPHARRRWTDRRIERARYSMSLFVWYFGTRRQYPDVAHHTILLGPRYRELLDGHLRAQGAGRRLQPLPAPADGDRSVARAAGLRRVLRAVAGAAPAAAAPTGATQAEPYRASDRARTCRRRCCRASTREIVTSRDAHAAGLPGPAARRSAARPSAWSRCSRRAPGSGRTTAARTSSGLYLVGAGTHPGAGLPGVLSSARVLDTVGPRCRRTAPDCPRTHRATPADFAALPRAAARRARAPSTRRRSCCRAACATPACALYAFCRVADDAVDDAGGDPAAALATLRERLDAIYAGTPLPIAVDRAFADVVARYAHSARAARGAARGLRLGRRAAGATTTCADAARPTRRASPARSGAMMALLMGARGARRAGARLRPRRRDAAHQHRARRRRGRARGPPLPAARLAARGRHRSRTRGWRAPVHDAGARRAWSSGCSAAADVLYARAAGGIAALPRELPARRSAARAASTRRSAARCSRRGCDAVSRRAVVRRRAQGARCWPRAGSRRRCTRVGRRRAAAGRDALPGRRGGARRAPRRTRRCATSPSRGGTSRRA